MIEPLRIVACSRFFHRWLILAFACVCACAAARAASWQADPENYRALLGKLQPGDELVLAPGTYLRGLPVHGLHGNAQQPIVIRGPAEGPPALFVGRENANTVSLANASHVQISHLVLDGRGLIVDAVKAEGGRACTQVHHIVLQDLVIIGHGAAQSVVGISTKCVAWNWVIRRNLIVGAGTGLYLGNSDGSAPFIGGLIEQNMVFDTVGYNLQIKHQNDRPILADLPTVRTRTIIRQNLFSKAHQASAGLDARPNVLVGHFPRQGAGADDVYEINHNVFFCNPVEALLQAEGNVSIARNVLVNPAGDALAVQAHNDVPKTVNVDANFVAASGRGVLIAKASPSHTQTVSDNWLFSPTPASGGAQQNNRVGLYPAGEPQLYQWLSVKNGSGVRAKEFAPLVNFAQRMCHRAMTGASPELVALQQQLSAHPACRLADALAGVRAAGVDRIQGVCLP